MKSLRKTVIVALTTLLIPVASMNAQETKPDTPAPAPERSAAAATGRYATLELPPIAKEES